MRRIKYPRTFHLPWSPGATDDDKTHTQEAIDAMFIGREVVVTEKLDGENTSIYPDSHVHARSVDSAAHPSRTWVRALAGQIAHNIPETFRVCGENVFAKHSIGYDALRSYFYTFGIYDGSLCLSWDDTLAYAEMLGLEVVPVLYRGTWDQELIKDLWQGRSALGGEGEGYVVRLASAFEIDAFRDSVAKWVRPHHVQTDQHWMHSEVVPNTLVDA